MKKKNNYPWVLVHGFSGFGEDDKISMAFPYFGLYNPDIHRICSELGCECHVPSVGPFTSAWDRACELYAQLTGTRVDFGKVHSERNGHSRYGRTYDSPLIKDWGAVGADGKINKINLVGHSYGGPTVRILIELMVRGSAEEIAGTPNEELSDLFKGGHTNWIHSCITLAATNNGTTLMDALDSLNLLKPVSKVTFTAISALGKTPAMKLWDMKLDHYGLSRKYRPGNTIDFKPDMDAVENIVSHDEDNPFKALSVKSTLEMTKNFTTFDTIYYFSYAGCRTVKVPIIKKQIPKPNMCIIDIPSAFLSGWYTNYDENEGAIIDEDWLANDGQVNVISARAPFDEPQTEFNTSRDIKTGIWYKMPVENKHHHSYMGFGQKPDEYRDFFYDIIYRVSNLDTVD